MPVALRRGKNYGSVWNSFPNNLKRWNKNRKRTIYFYRIELGCGFKRDNGWWFFRKGFQFDKICLEICAWDLGAKCTFIHFHLHIKSMSDSDKHNIKCNRDKSVRIWTNTTLMIVPCMNAVNRIQIFPLFSVKQIDFFVHRTQLTFFESLYINASQQKPLNAI